MAQQMSMVQLLSNSTVKLTDGDELGPAALKKVQEILQTEKNMGQMHSNGTGKLTDGDQLGPAALKKVQEILQLEMNMNQLLAKWSR